jgi:hypothetical protein
MCCVEGEAFGARRHGVCSTKLCLAQKSERSRPSARSRREVRGVSTPAAPQPALTNEAPRHFLSRTSQLRRVAGVCPSYGPELPNTTRTNSDTRRVSCVSPSDVAQTLSGLPRGDDQGTSHGDGCVRLRQVRVEGLKEGRLQGLKPDCFPCLTVSGTARARAFRTARRTELPTATVSCAGRVRV